MTPHEQMAVYGPGNPADSDIIRTARLQQAMWRVDHEGVTACGISNDKRPPGKLQSLLPPGEQAHNFLTSSSYAYARERLDDKTLREPVLTLRRDRLLTNMLSSQPMCFNLFTVFRLAAQRGDTIDAAALSRLLDVPMDHVDGVIVEEAPTGTSRQSSIEVEGSGRRLAATLMLIPGMTAPTQDTYDPPSICHTR